MNLKLSELPELKPCVSDDSFLLRMETIETAMAVLSGGLSLHDMNHLQPGDIIVSTNSVRRRILRKEKKESGEEGEELICFTSRRVRISELCEKYSLTYPAINGSPLISIIPLGTELFLRNSGETDILLDVIRDDHGAILSVILGHMEGVEMGGGELLGIDKIFQKK